MPVDLARLRSLAADLQVRQQESLRRPVRGIAVMRLSSSALCDKYNPQQPRDPHTGEWGFSDGAWIAETVRTAAGAVQIGAGDNDMVTLGFDAPGGGRASVALRLNTSGDLADLLSQAAAGDDGWKVGRERAVHEYNGKSSGYATSFVGITRTEDGYHLEFASGTGGTPPEPAGVLAVTGAEAGRMVPVVDRLGGAQKVETDHGRAVTLVEKDGTVSASLPATGGKRLDLVMTPEQAGRVHEAIRDEVGYIDEYPQDGHGNPKYGPDDMVHRSTVQLDGTEIYISSYGQYDNGGYMIIESSAHDWYLKLPAGQTEDIGSALENTSGQALVIAEYESRRTE